MSNQEVNAQIGFLIESNSEIKTALVETNKSLNTLIKNQIRTEERQIADREWQKRVEAHQDKQDEKIDTAQSTANEAKSQSLSNARWVNLGVAMLTGIVIFIAKEVISKFMG